MGLMTSAAARDNGLRRLSDLTTWLGVGAVAVTGVFAGLAAHASHTTTSTSSTTAGASSAATAAFATGSVPTASPVASHVRSGAS